MADKEERAEQIDGEEKNEEYPETEKVAEADQQSEASESTTEIVIEEKEEKKSSLMVSENKKSAKRGKKVSTQQPKPTEKKGAKAEPARKSVNKKTVPEKDHKAHPEPLARRPQQKNKKEHEKKKYMTHKGEKFLVWGTKYRALIKEGEIPIPEDGRLTENGRLIRKNLNGSVKNAKSDAKGKPEIKAKSEKTGKIKTKPVPKKRFVMTKNTVARANREQLAHYLALHGNLADMRKMARDRIVL